MILTSLQAVVVIFALSLCFAITLLGQEPIPKTFELKGVIRDNSGTVFPGLRIRFKSENSENSSLTDLNGEFYVRVPRGDFVVLTDHLSASDFRAYLRVTEVDQNPGFLEFIVNWDRVVCAGPKDKPLPKVINATEPVYPAAAKAVRAGGEVTILLKIMPDGHVQSGIALSGHPLLRRAAEVAAAKYRFESDANEIEREAQLTFVFLPDQDKKPTLSRLNCPNRIVVFGDTVILQTSNTH